MTSKYFLTLGLTLLSSTFVFGQLKTFDLSKYKLADINFRSFTNSFDYSGNGERDYNLAGDSARSSARNTNVRYNGAFTHIRNTRERQKTTSFNIGFQGYQYNANKDMVRERRNYDWNISSSVTNMNRFYGKRRQFLEIQVKGLYRFNQEHRYYSEDGEVTTEQIGENKHTFSLSVPVKLGLGRIERVEDARQAVFLIQQLQRQDRFNQTVGDSEVLALASFVTQLRNTRFFDLRLQRIYQLEQLDSFFHSNNLTDTRDSRYYTTTMDYWMFGGQPARNSGQRISLAFYPAATAISSDYVEKAVNQYIPRNQWDTIRQLFFGFEYVLEKPLSLCWQYTLEAGMYWGRRNTNTAYEVLLSETENSLELPGMTGLLSQELGFYPSTRTQISLNNSLGWTRIHEFLDDDLYGNANGFERLRITTACRVTYYVSPRFRISGLLSFVNTIVPLAYESRTDIGFPFNPYIGVPNSYFDPTVLPELQQEFYRTETRSSRFNGNLRVTYSLF